MAIGYGAGRLWRERLRVVIDWFVAASLYVVVPLFIFGIMWSSDIVWGRFGRLTVAVLGVLAGGGFLAWALSRHWGWPFRELCLPVVFMNSIYLALPINTLLFGPSGAAATLVFNIVVTIVHFTLGVWWVRRSGKSAWGEVLGMPILYATLAGTGLNIFNVPCPETVMVLSRGLAGLALPAMLMVLGVRMAEVPWRDWQNAGSGVLLRMGGGAALGWGLAVLLGLSGVEKGVVVVTASMPSAVNTYILSEKFESRPAFAAAMVTLGTAVSAVTLPILGWLLK